MPHVAKLFHLARGARAGDDDLPQLEGIRRQGEVVRDGAPGERHFGGLRLVAQAARHEGDGLTRDAGARHDDRVAPVFSTQRAKPHRRNRDFGLGDRRAGVACHGARDGNRLLGPHETGPCDERGEEGSSEESCANG